MDDFAATNRLEAAALARAWDERAAYRPQRDGRVTSSASRCLPTPVLNCVQATMRVSRPPSPTFLGRPHSVIGKSRNSAASVLRNLFGVNVDDLD